MSRISGWVLDIPAITRFAEGDEYARGVVWVSVEHNSTLLVPSTALAAAYSATSPSKQDVISVLFGLPITIVDSLDAARAADLGTLHSNADSPEDLAHDPTALAAVHAVWLSRERDWPIITDSTLRVHAVHPGTEVKRLR